MYQGLFESFLGLLAIYASFFVKNDKSHGASFLKRYHKQVLIIGGIAMIYFGMKTFIKDGRVRQSIKVNIEQKSDQPTSPRSTEAGGVPEKTNPGEQPDVYSDKPPASTRIGASSWSVNGHRYVGCSYRFH
jgi:hypothetical protein